MSPTSARRCRRPHAPHASAGLARYADAEAARLLARAGAVEQADAGDGRADRCGRGPVRARSPGSATVRPERRARHPGVERGQAGDASAQVAPAATAPPHEQRASHRAAGAGRERRAAARQRDDGARAAPAPQRASPRDAAPASDHVPAGASRSVARARWPTAGAHGVSTRDVLAQGGEALLADAGDLVELVDAPEAAVLLAVVEDLLGGGRADAVERVELLERRGVEVDRRRLRAPRPAWRGRRVAPLWRRAPGRGSGDRPRAWPRG